MDADGDLDLVLPINSTNAIRVFRNNGSGAFPQMSSSGTGGIHPTGSTLGDFEPGRDLDVAVANSSTSTVSILRNSGFRLVSFFNDNRCASGAQPYHRGGFRC